MGTARGAGNSKGRGAAFYSIEDLVAFFAEAPSEETPEEEPSAEVPTAEPEQKGRGGAVIGIVAGAAAAASLIIFFLCRRKEEE